MFLLLEFADEVDLASSPALLRAMEAVRAIVEVLPEPDNLLRESEWRRMLPEVRRALDPYSEAFGDELIGKLVEATPDMQEHAFRMAERAGIPPSRLVSPTGSGVERLVGIEVGGQRLTDLLGIGQGTSPLTRQNIRKVNQLVTRGILESQPTPEIAKQILQVIERQGQTYINTRGNTVTRNIKATSETIARTAIQDANHRLTRATWDANEEAIRRAGFVYEWTAALDARTCEQCAPLDGMEWKNKNDAPNIPIHPNCRCGLVLKDPTDDFFNNAPRSGQQLYEEMQPDGYKTKVKVKGEKFYRTREEMESGSRYADYLLQSNELTQREFFGGGPPGGAGDQRREFFLREVKGGKDPQRVLSEMTSGKAGNRRFIPVNDLPQEA